MIFPKCDIFFKQKIDLFEIFSILSSAAPPPPTPDLGKVLVYEVCDLWSGGAVERVTEMEWGGVLRGTIGSESLAGG